ncbi:MAG: hypothetical protein KDB23_28180, partial [Planctomycetales bacterium]|nr:hypothetical protein [Planctomycetales bacterium]
MPLGSDSITDAQATSSWTVVRQWGLVPRSSIQPLQFPTRAFRAPDGTTLIAEELGIHKQVPFRFECRTIRVNKQGELMFDSTDLGIDDGFGCLIGDNRIALLRRTHWELLLLSELGEIERRLPLERVSKRIPRYVCWTHQGTLLVVFFNRSFEIDIAELDCNGRLLWFLPASSTKIGIPASVQLLASDRLLLADSFRHIILEIDRDGQPHWQHGQAGSPGDTEGRLSSPNSVETTGSGGRLIVDTRNHLVLTQSAAGGLPMAHPCESGLCDPTYATGLAHGHTLICDTGHARVLEVDAQGRLVWQYGGRPVLDRPFSYPRSIDILGPNDFLVADTGKNRVLRLQGDQISSVQTPGGLFWPRCCRRVGHDGLLIADARNGRIVE